MEKKNIDWANLGFGYVNTDYRFVSNFKKRRMGRGSTDRRPNGNH